MEKKFKVHERSASNKRKLSINKRESVSKEKIIPVFKQIHTPLRGHSNIGTGRISFTGTQKLSG